MPLDNRMTKLRDLLAPHEVPPSADLLVILPIRDGRPGKCFEDAEGIIMNGRLNAGLVLVHGKCLGPDGAHIDHAWLDVPGGLIYDPVLGRIYPWQIYKRTIKAIADHRYTMTQVLEMLKHSDTFGPWNDEERQNAGFGNS